ncbi:MAG: CDP-glycerol glycerophosphotransferase family protein [Clostridia bacterium]|nr:CDP-glycerol glycerophosphotransferase family protein [Clostridia bacterium]
MREAQKQNIMEILNTVEEANNIVETYVNNGQIASAKSILPECQNATVSIINTLQSFEGNDCNIIQYFKDYCNEAYKVYNEIGETEEDLIKDLKAKFIVAKEHFVNDIKVRKEVVFMPYEASMWDSLESIWKAAVTDDTCDVFVVPIPYYDKNKDGTLGKMHYDGKAFPSYVPITHYNNYSLEQRTPDVIYIHNPYDDINYVTTVAPKYYSTELKKYTNMLVYVPYFISEEIDYNNAQMVANKKTFVLTPGVVNSDRVILQSEEMKAFYTKILLEYFGDTEENRKIIDNKLLGLGSPKIDKVFEIKKEDYEISDEWKKIIKKADGTDKKVVFFNTTISMFLNFNEVKIEKLKDTLKYFKSIKDDIALLWRPHPLIESTLASMRPNLLEEYKNIVKEYKEENWGIFDDSSDMYRAISISDAYYGDNSSVAVLYLKIGKPLLIANMEIRNG